MGPIRPDDAGLEPDSFAEGNLSRGLSFSAGTSTRANPCGLGERDPVPCPVEETTETKSGVGGSTASSPSPGRAVSAKWPSPSVRTGLRIGIVPVVGVARTRLIDDARTGDRPARSGLDDPAAQDAAFGQG